MNVIDDTIDFDAYLKGPNEAPMIQPASIWADEVIAAFERPANHAGACLPWPKTREMVRLRSGELTIWPGMSGHGKSMMVGQVALHLMEQGEKVCLASMEMKPTSTMQRMCRQAFGCNIPNRQDIRDLHAWTNGRLWLYDQQGQVSPDRILAVARYCHEASLRTATTRRSNSFWRWPPTPTTPANRFTCWRTAARAKTN